MIAVIIKEGALAILLKKIGMERILLAIDAVNPDKGALEFACYLGKLTKSKITGVFLENMVARDQPVSVTSHEKTGGDCMEV